eukprot:TRINITY_DN109228_c0_g1_i1.p1 TRINITY_DN109228_c0_g1~~TRINITY_DN109228_c0_g1_i1.p1  ORF type:complete len:261 (-),score=63.46 TRINITY_DN109228_c0_g1_i1:21-803(-)
MKKPDLPLIVVFAAVMYFSYLANDLGLDIVAGAGQPAFSLSPALGKGSDSDTRGETPGKEEKHKDVFADPPVPPVTIKNKHRWVNPYGYGDICAAGMLFYFLDSEGRSTVLLQIEADAKDGKKTLAAFGGKVEREDRHWCETAFREFQEETGGLLHPSATSKLKDARFRCTASETVYVPAAKFQMLYHRIEDEDIAHFQSLIFAYKAAYKGSTVSGRRGLSLIFVPVDSMPVVNEEHLRVKPELQAALKRWGAPLTLARS